MKDKFLRRLTFIASAAGALPLSLMIIFFNLRDAETELVVLSVLMSVIYLLFIPSLIAALAVIQKRDTRSAIMSAVFFCGAYFTELAVMTFAVLVI